MMRLLVTIIVASCTLIFPIAAQADDPVVCTDSGGCGWVKWDPCYDPVTRESIADCEFEGV